jgi:hypothetical protein
MPSIKVAVAGATGSAGIPIVHALLAGKYQVTALSRPGSNSSSKLPEDPNLSIVQVDYNSMPSLTRVLEGHTVVIASLPTETPIGSQNPIIDACIAAGVTRFFPAEFGTDTNNPKSMKLPVFANKIQTLDYLRAKVAMNPTFSYTALCPGVFLDWGLEVGFMVDPKRHSATIYDGGDHPFSTTTLATIGKAVVSVISHLDETKNRHIYIQDMSITQNKLISVTRGLDGKDWNLSHTSCAAAEAEAYLELKKENPDIRKGLFPLLHLSVLGEGYGGDFSAHLDNELLGITSMGDEELRILVGKHL